MWDKIKSALGMGEPPDSPEISEAKRRMAIDHADVRKRYVWCIRAVTDDQADPAYQPQFATTALREWYGMSSARELADNIELYLKGTGSTPAYDVARAVFMARSGFGAGFLSDADSWEASFRAARKMKAAYPSWNHYGTDYIEGHLAYRRDEGDPEAALARYRSNMYQRFGEVARQGPWVSTPFETPI